MRYCVCVSAHELVYTHAGGEREGQGEKEKKIHVLISVLERNVTSQVFYLVAIQETYN